MKKFYITTAIDYANGPPHLGHAYEKVLTDVTARHRRLTGRAVHFLTGTDEHGQKVQQSAQRRGVPPQQLADEITAMFQDLCGKLLISNDDFIRTSEERHKKTVRDILTKLHEKGEIYKAEYKGFYSVRQEQFVQEKEKVDGRWPGEYGEVLELSEANYFFRLAKYQDWLADYLKRHDDFIFPRFRQKQVAEFLKEPINDLCVSRPKERLAWGIPLPFDEAYVTYVWFDALINYISAAGYGNDTFAQYWPADFHVIGKDILTPAHAVYWPIMLQASGIPLPRSLLVHGFWSMAGAKLSKSTGHTVNPLELIDKFGPDAFRYFVTREMNVGQDSEFSVELFLTRYNDDLGNDLGNLVSRLLNMGGRYCQGKIPRVSLQETPERELQEHWNAAQEEIRRLYEGFQFHTALERIFGFIRGINRYAEVRAPWKLAKSEMVDDRRRLETALAVMAESLRLAAAALAPVMPATAEKIYALLGLPPLTAWERDLEWSSRLDGNSLGEKTILFPRPQTEDK